MKFHYFSCTCSFLITVCFSGWDFRSRWSPSGFPSRWFVIFSRPGASRGILFFSNLL